MLIIPSKEVLLISANQNEELFLFDPKTSAVLHKYKDESCICPTVAYYPYSQQFITPQLSKTFLSVWSTDTDEPELKVSVSEVISVLRMSEDGHFLLAGSMNGNLLIWELNGGVLLKKKNVHSNEIKNIIEYTNGYIFTQSTNECKMWSLSSFLIETQGSVSIKNYTSILNITTSLLARNILALLTQKNITFLQCTLQTETKQLEILNKVQFQYACCMTSSNTLVYVGDFNGNIQYIELFQKSSQNQNLQFKVKESTQELEIHRQKKRRTLQTTSKYPITALTFLTSLNYLISGNSHGEVTIWSNHQAKKTLQLFKTSINGLTVFPKPKNEKVAQSLKIKPLNKYELGKDQEWLDIIPNKISEDNPFQTNFQEAAEYVEEEIILDRMLQVLKGPQRAMKEELIKLRTEKQKLIEANLHYSKMFA